MTAVLAVELLADRVRVAAVDLNERPLSPAVVHEAPHAPVRQQGVLRWDWEGIVREAKQGIDRALDAGRFSSIGVHGFGVDYGLLDRNGALVAAPCSYLDSRTDRWGDVADRIGREALYASTGTQLMAINTLFQLALHTPLERDRARTMLMLPDLLVHELSGFIGVERSNAATTGMLDVRSGAWAKDLVEAAGISAAILPEVVEPGHMAGSYRGVPVHVVASHDTASAFLATPSTRGTAVLAADAWVLVAAEPDAPILSEAARNANFSNELGASGESWFLKNVLGLSLVEACLRRWGPLDAEQTWDEVATTLSSGKLFDATHRRFLAPLDITAEIRDAAGLPADASHAQVLRCVLDSIGKSTAKVIFEMEMFLRRPITALTVIGAGANNELLQKAFQRYTQLPLATGSPEAAVLGNALAQGLALRVFSSVTEARGAVAA